MWVFKCPTPKCPSYIKMDGLNEVKIKVLRRVPRTCESCKQRSLWNEIQLMIDIAQVRPKASLARRHGAKVGA